VISIFRIYSQYQPLKVFWGGAVVMGTAALAVFLRFLILFVQNPHTAKGHVQSLIAGAVLFLSNAMGRRWLLALVVGFCVSAQVAGADIYRRNYQLQRQVWWQIYWRVPGLKSGTYLAFRNPTLDNSAPSQVPTFEAANLIYSPPGPQPSVWGGVLSDDILRRLQTGDGKYRENWSSNVTFAIDLDHMLVIALPQDGACLRVLDGARGELPARPDGILAAAAPSSRIEHVLTTVATPATMPTDVIGQEIPRGWCHTFQIGELARQAGDWAQVARIADEANARGWVAVDPTEWMVFLEGYLRTDRMADAKRVAQMLARSPSPLRPHLCRQLQGIVARTPGLAPHSVAALSRAADCRF
jgi:hypothetical protein